MNKTISKWFSLLLLMIVGTVSASAQLTADNTEIDRGATKQITLTYSGTEAIYGYQTDIVLPEGLSWAADPAEADEVFTASSSAQGTNGKRVVAYSAAGNTVAPQTEVLTFSVKASDDFNGGAIQLTNTKISLADDVQQNVANAVIEVSLAKYATKYAGEFEHGRVEDVYDVLAGQSVTLTAYPEEGYKVASIYGTWVNTEPEQRVEIDAETLTFNMPASSVYIFATFEAIPYNVTISEMANGTVTASSATATIGSTVTLTVTPDAGYELETLTVMNGETAVEVAADNTFVMPAAAVTVTATFKQTVFAITVADATNGTVSVDPTSAVAGATVTITATPDQGYELDALTVMNGETAVEVAADNTFVMPAAAVTVTATFKQSEETPVGDTVTDYITYEVTGVTGTSYKDFADKTVVSPAVYAGQCAGDANTVQLRSSNSNSGVITTTSGGTLAEVAVKFNAKTTAARVLDVYASNTPYSAATDLYGENAGTKIASLAYADADNDGIVNVTVTDEYKYVGFRSSNGALYCDYIKVVWNAAGDTPEPTTYAVTVAETENGTVVADPTTAEEGATVTLTVTPAENYEVDAVSAAYNDVTGAPVAVDLTVTETGYTFVMPAADVTVTATFKASEVGPVDGLTAVSDKMWNFSDFEDQTITATTIIDNIEIAASDKKNVVIEGNTKSIDDYSFTKRLKLGGKTETGVRYLRFKVVPNSNITVYAISSSSSEERVLNLDIPEKGTTATSKTFGSTIDKLTYEYTGETETDVFVYGPDAALNLYGIVVAPITSEPTTYNVAVAETENGAVVADPTIAEEGATVTLTVTPAENYEIDAVSAAYNDVTGAPVELELTATETGYTFVMPAADVTVTATFKAIPEPVVVPAIVNPSFELADADNNLTDEIKASNGSLAIYGWTEEVDNSFNNTEIRKAESASTTSQFGTSAPSEGEYALFFRHGWNGSGVATTFTSTALDKLPAGNYKLSVDYKQHYSYDNTTNTNTWVGIALKSGETEIASAKSEPAAGVNGGSSDATYFNTAEWSTLTAAFTVTEDVETSNVVITLNAGGQRRSDFFIDNVQLVAVPEADIARAALAEEIAKAEAEQAKYGVGEGLFQYPESEIQPIADAIAAAKTVLNDETATAQTISEATQTLKDAEEAFAPKMTEPEADKAYILSVTTDAGTFQLNIEGTANTIAEQGTPIYFAKQEDGTYALTADKENYVVYEGSNAWTMSTSATPYGFTIAALADGGYTIKGKNGFYATNKGNGDAAGSTVYGDKSASNGNYIWNIALAEEETPVVDLKGDVSNDGKLSVVDVTMTVDFIVEAAEPTAYQKAAADMNGDETITVDDAAQIIQGILDFDYNAAEEVEQEPTAKARVSNADFLAIDGSRIDLNNSNEFVAFQMDVTVNGTLNAVNLTNRTANHTLRYNKISDNTYRIVVLSMSNSKLEGNNGAILDIDAIGDFEISNARFIDSSINACYINVDNTVTGISDVEAATLNAKAIYTVGGARVNTLQKGLNIVRKADGTTVKVFVK